MSAALLKFIAKHEPRSVVFLSINDEKCIGLLQVLRQEQIIDHDIEYKCKHLVKTCELIEIVNGKKSEFVYYNGYIGNEFHFRNGIIHRPYESCEKIKYEKMYDMTVDYQETYIIKTTSGSWDFQNDQWNFIMVSETDSETESETNSADSADSTQSLENFAICDCL